MNPFESAQKFLQKTSMMASRVEDTLQALDRIEQHADQIYVRDDWNGAEETFNLLELPAKRAIRHVCRMIRQGLTE